MQVENEDDCVSSDKVLKVPFPEKQFGDQRESGSPKVLKGRERITSFIENHEF